MNANYFEGLVGGVLIGVAVVTLYLFNGRILGVSGILGRLLAKWSKDSAWRAAFIIGLLGGGFIWQLVFSPQIYWQATILPTIIAGLMVGFGTTLANGCTSGHGICGMARLSKRSISATVIFMAAGMLMVWVMKHLGGL